ncbi:MAG: SNF2-related protein [Acidobacteriota bacterium]
MSLEQRCLDEVAPADRDRGRQYFAERRVKIDASDDHGLNATVRGAGRTYEVQIDWFDSEHSGVLTASCQCPGYRAGRLCKHIWATLLTADQRGIAKRIPGQGPLQVFLESGEAAADALESTNGTMHVPIAASAPKSSWRKQFQTLRRALEEANADSAPRLDAERPVHYRLNVLKSLHREQLVVDLFQQMGRDPGSVLRPLETDRDGQHALSAEDRGLVDLLAGVDGTEARAAETSHQASGVLPPVLYRSLLPSLCATGRFGWINGLDEGQVVHRPLAWDGERPWSFVLSVERREDEDLSARLSGHLKRGTEARELSDPLMLLPEGVVIFSDSVALFEADGWLGEGDAFGWASALRRDGEIEVDESDVDAMLEDLWSMPTVPRLEMPVQWDLDQPHVVPQPMALFQHAGEGPLAFEVTTRFDYDGLEVEPGQPSPRGTFDRIVDRPHGRLVKRDLGRERSAVGRLAGLVRRQPGRSAEDEVATNGRPFDGTLRVSFRDFPEVAQALIDDGWIVEAQGQRVRKPSQSAIGLSVSSSVDWFELEGEIDYGVAFAELPSLLEAVRQGEMFVRLDDGTLGLLPEEWIERYASLAVNTAEAPADSGGSVRFLPSQALLLDSLLEDEDVDTDRNYERIREQLQGFDHLEPAKEPRGFKGELRSYQQEGLGWLKFLKEHGFGGCLADDMGLGKTVQVLALLQIRRLRPLQAWERVPSIIVVPRSLVHNWIDEASRFTPKLKMLNYTGPGREEQIDFFDDYDVIVTTYGTLRRDIESLDQIEFDYAILDEAQAIKNASSQAAKACRRLRAAHRLALTGTPVENHLGELWSIFEFLNPGMLGQSVLKDLVGAPADSEALATVSAALKPFIFRRTKEQVLDDLPEKTEATIYCDLEGEQRRFYDELRDHYRAALEERIEQVGLKKSKIQVLEALLRLRQAACHPGLIDPERTDGPSAKLEVVLQQLEEVLDEGHKALVFSQFTSLLAILREHLDARGVVYEYLDGRTRRREDRVERFQTDPDCGLFLISLKAGGVGLNLTAADYVFILDPWWNPAVEAQAVDRAHRIGQLRPVFAYRLISRGTVEEKIMELQGSKKQLADAILSADKSLIGDLSADDLKVLLS